VTTAPSPNRKSSALRLGAAAIAASAALVGAGCGTTSQLTAHAHRASAARFTTVHTTQQVAQHFYAATGDTLTVERDQSTFDTLSAPASNEKDYNRYGVFSVYVVHNPRDLSVFTSQNGHGLTPDGQGIYWPTAPDSSGYWNPAKIYGNVVLSWTTQSRSTNGQFRLLDAILSTLGQSASAVNAKLPPSELACQARGITASSAREGTCTENGVSISVVNSTDVLHTPGYNVQILKDAVGSYIPSAFTYGQPLEAKGAFLAVAVRVANNGNAPLDGLDGAELEVDGRYYSQDDDATFDLSPEQTFPLQPGDQGGTVLAFDVPPSVAASALNQGELVFPEGADAFDIQDASKIGAVRLAGTSGASRHGEPALHISPA
jgi:hypothetical protein